MSVRGRLRASFILLAAGCLGLSVLTAAPATAAAASTTTTTTRSTTTATTASAAAEPGTTGAAGAATSSAGHGPAVATPKPSTPALQKLTASQPDYAPAGCNIPDPRPGYATCDALVKTNTLHQLAADVSAPPTGALGPAQIQAAYSLPADGGAGRTVAIVDAFGDSDAESDLAAFRAQYGLPACTSANGCFRKTDQTGGTDYPADDPGWGEETSLDLDAVSSACPDCHILLVEADSASGSDLGAATNTAVSLGAQFVSNSYGIPGEDPTEASDTDYDHSGVVVAAAAGDIANEVNWPASDPDVVSVGGTTLTQDTSTTRGWSEAAWTSGGSGCSAYEPQPAYQVGLGTDCANRAISDLSADADPNSGLAVYDTLGQSGWVQVGGTSLSTPLVTAMYAVAGDPTSGTYPVTYPYAHGGADLNDVTQGSNGTCGDVLCQAGPGWDGPTGLGTPNGVGALSLGPVGTLTGQITTGSGGTAVSGASVVFTDSAQGETFHTQTNAQGGFTLTAAAGSYTETATEYGYAEASASDVQLADGQTATADLVLTAVPSATVSGVVTDGSGHGWPLYATVDVAGDPNGTVYTNPKTGAYSISLPQQSSYDVTVTPVYPGYVPTDTTLSLGTSARKQNFTVAADQVACTAPGYAYPGSAYFDGWTGDTAQDGWSATTGSGAADGWEFDDPGSLSNLTPGGSGNFATADSYDNGGAQVDGDLVSPVIDLAHQAVPSLQFDTAYLPDTGSVAEIDLSTDGGTTWTELWNPDGATVWQAESIPLTQAAGKPDVRLRFHFEGAGVTLWQLDNVTVGTCSLVGGGLVEGTITDANTSQPLNGAVVTDRADPQASTASTATPADPNLPDGFYWLFAQNAGRHSYTTSDDRYATLDSSVPIVSDSVVQANLALQAGQLKVSQNSASLTTALGKQTSDDVTLTNTGRAPLHVALGEQNSGASTANGVSTAAAQGAPPQRIPGDYPAGPASRNTAAPGPSSSTSAAGQPAVAPAADEAWQALADYPEPILDNATGYYAGKVYSVGGVQTIFGGVPLTDGFVYDPTSASWSAIAPLPQGREAASGAFLDGTMYVVGGWDGTATGQSTVYAYHPTSNTWSQVASLPQGEAAGSIAVLNGYLYQIGGCDAACDAALSTVYRYSPATNTWTSVAPLPGPMQFGACAGTSGEIVCAGGLDYNSSGNVVGLSTTYVYNPQRNTWTQAANMPYPDWAASSSGANGEMQVVGGISGSDATNQAEQYDPVHNVWTALPAAISPIYQS
jgi:N-acetylneuraminic acid mutarotase